MIADRTCATCAWHDSFSWACFNGDSPYCADFTQNEQKCLAWEQNGQKEPQNRQNGRKPQKERRKPLTADGSTADGGRLDRLAMR